MKQTLSSYNVVYRVFDENMEPRDEPIEVWAYSEEQAAFLAPCNPRQVLYIEKAVAKKVAYA